MKNSRSKNYILHTLKNAKHITITQIACFCKILGNVALFNIPNKTYIELIKKSKDFENYKDFTIEDIIYDVKHGTIPYKRYCKGCGKLLHIKTIKAGYINTCGSKQCYHDHWVSANRESIFKKYGVYNIQQIEDVKLKTQNTCLKKYGVKNGGCSKQALEKIRKTMLDRYGVEHALQNPVFANKFKNTCIERFGVDCPLKNIDILNKIENNKINNKFGIFNSKLENDIVNYIKTIYNDEIIINDWSILNGYQLDVVLPKIKIAFEINGLYWHAATADNKFYHFTKSYNSINNDYVLFHIFENEWKKSKNEMKMKIYNVINGITEKLTPNNCNNYIIDLKWPNVNIPDNFKFIKYIEPEIETYKKYKFYNCGKIVLST